jgi:type I restriction enzyme S subunit
MREEWVEIKIEDLLDYIQPTNYIVDSTEYSNRYNIPVLTPGKTFVLGYTNEEHNVFNSLPVIIFDDFTTASKYVNFRFKVKSSAMKILVPTSKWVNLKYVYYYMQTIQHNTDTHKRYWISIYSKLPIILPPLVEQKAIVSKIEELLSELDNGIANLDKAKEKLGIYRQAVLKKAFEGELTKEWREGQSELLSVDNIIKQISDEREKYYEKQLKDWEKDVDSWKLNEKQGNKPKKPRKVKKLTPFTTAELSSFAELPYGWKWVKVDSIHGHDQYSIKAGPFGSALKKSCYVEKGYKIYGQEQVIANDWKIGDYYVDETKFKELKSCEVKPGDVLISLVGTVGKILILPHDILPGIINPRLIKISLADKFYLPEFFKYYFESTYLKGIYSTKSHGATMDIINLGIIQELPFPLLTIEEQKQVVSEIETRLSLCDNILLNIDEGLEKAKALKQSILKKAFEGKLLSEVELEQCRKKSDWEPAEKLLERIKEMK